MTLPSGNFKPAPRNQTPAEPGGNLTTPFVRPVGDGVEPGPGARIGGYRLIEIVGRGGMGIVYRAEQDNPRRTVALKLIRAGLADSQVHARFEFEAQILGRLQHPGIAQIYEAGTTDSGRGPQPFFAMEFVEGRLLSAYLATAQPGIRARLELFVKICAAVQHAHTKGVIHRDLKPANILVVEERQDPRIERAEPKTQPKILDFGVARVADAEFEAHTLQTTIGQLIGTLPYMSPEQIAGDPRELDTRSDVYALGVILYEMLSGRLPYDVSRLTLPEVARVIREVEPASLSSVNRALGGDLEIIVRCALEKEKSRRYQSAADLAADVQRFLRDEPIAARPPSAWYQLSKFARRRKALVIGLATATVAIVGGLIATSAALGRALVAEAGAQQAQRRAEAARDSADRQRRVADDERRRATDEAETAAAVNAFLNEMLASVNPEGGNREVTVREVLDRAATKVGDAFPDRPRVEASLRETIGRSYLGLGQPEEAAAQFRASLALREKEAGPHTPALYETMNNLASACQNAGRADEAEALFRRSLEGLTQTLGAERPETLSVTNNLGMLLIQRGHYSEAEPLLRSAAEGHRKVSGPESMVTLDALSNLAILLQFEGKLEDAETLSRETLATRRRALGNLHPGTLVAVNNHGTLLALRGKYEEAEPLYFESLDLSRHVLGPEHPETLISMANVAGLVRDRGRAVEAEPLYRETLRLQEKVLGDTHADTIDTRRNLASTLRELGQLDEAEREARAAVDAARRGPGEDSPDLAASEHALGEVFLEQKRFPEAETVLRQAWERATRVQGPGVWKTASYQAAYGDALLALGRLEAAEAELRAAQGALAEALGDDHYHTQHVVESLTKLYRQMGRADEADGWRARLKQRKP